MRTGQTTADDAGLLIGRLLMVVLFIPAGLQKAMHFSGTVGMMQALHAPFPTLGAGVAVLCEVGVSLLIAIGLQTRVMCLVMILFTAGTTYLAHRFWLMPADQVMQAQINFFKNVAIMGGFLILASAGPGRWSVDRG